MINKFTKRGKENAILALVEKLWNGWNESLNKFNFTNSMKQTVELYTDGASKGNPGPAGYGLILKYGKYEKEYNKGFRRSTNNRMELLAVIVGLEMLTRPNQNVTVYTDSKYVADPINKGWIYGWIKKDFKGKKNVDLWKRYLKASKAHQVQFEWIKGHNNHYYNEKCDQLAVQAALEPTQIDHVFEQSEQDD